MKQIFLQQSVILIFLLGFSSFTMAQSRRSQSPVSPVQIGSMVLSLGAGAGADYKGDNYGTGFGTKVAAEWGLWHAGRGVVTLGGEFGGSFSDGGYYSNYKARTLVLAIRSAWHFGWNVPGLDTYGGFSTGAGFHHYTYYNDANYDHTETIPVFGAFAGASYFVTPQFGFNAEAGYDITNFQAGIIFKLR